MENAKFSLYLYFDSNGVLASLLTERPLEERIAALNCVVEFARAFGLSGNLWQKYLAYQLLMQENAFSLECERRGIVPEATLCKLALHDLASFRNGFASSASFNADSPEAWLADYRSGTTSAADCNSQAGLVVTKLAEALATTTDDTDFLRTLVTFYRDHGVGKLGLNRAFRLADYDASCGRVNLLPISNLDPVRLDDLVGYDEQKRELVANTEAFLAGHPANNVLLYGDSGTGKSSSIKALVNTYYDSGLRMIELHKHQFQALSSLVAYLKGRAYRFVLLIDDLSFEDNELEYKYLKSVIEGGLENRPENVLIYATSNRRHLIKETWRDRADMEHDGDIHHSDTVEEKLSLAERFGIAIRYGNPTPAEYRRIIEALAARQGLQLTERQLNQEAGAWEIRHGGVSGRTARQFVDYLAGRQ